MVILPFFAIYDVHWERRHANLIYLFSLGYGFVKRNSALASCPFSGFWSSVSGSAFAFASFPVFGLRFRFAEFRFRFISGFHCPKHCAVGAKPNGIRTSF
jgi:hypothetical protein